MDRIATAQELGITSDVQKKSLAFSMGDAACFGGMVGCGETYLPAFALAIGLGETAAGLVASVPLLAGGILQLISPWGIRLLGSLRRWVVLGACLQGLAFVPLAIAATVGTFTLPLLLLVASLYWAAGLSTGPAWNSWMERLVPAETRARFFSRRSRLQLTCTFCSLLGAGLLLQYASQWDRSLSGFAVLFCFAAAFRLLSAGFLYRQEDGHYSLDPISKKRPATNELARERQVPGAAKRLLMYLVLMQGCVQLSGPFFVPYMLKQLEFGYGQYVFLISLSFVSKVISVAFWGRFAERSGATKLLWLGGFGLVPLASLWILSTNFWWLAVIQILSGIAWAAYELGFFLSFFETLPTGQRTKLLTIYNLANTLAICVGALTGWAVLSYFGCHSSTYYCLFAASSLGRLLCLSVLIGFVSPKRKIRSMVLRILSVRPGAGSIGAPVVASQTDS